ncbi:MAG: acetoacetate--CoA ligase, partial [Chloroflexota bacterium]
DERNYNDLYLEVQLAAAALRRLGVTKGDRVAAYLPNTRVALVALLATASIGAIWTSCAPDFGAQSVLDRFSQTEPKVLFAVDGYTYNGKRYSRTETVAQLQAALPSLEQTVLVPLLGDADMSTLSADTMTLGSFVRHGMTGEALTFEPVPFDHPLWVLYSSGTTGKPKPIVHGHGGIILEHAKATVFHNDLKPEDRFFWYSSTGWMMWNYTIGALLSGCSIVLYDGSPSHPDMNALWRMAADLDVTYFGTSAAFVSACMNAGITPNADYDLSAIRALGSTGSPLTPAGFAWIYDNVNESLALESLSGGTDLCTAFVGGARTKPIYAGELQGASLGAALEAYDESGSPVRDTVAEMVLTAPMPSMPVTFWNDPDMTRYRASYFEAFDGVWRHGDWIKINDRNGVVIYGRSDATINRGGVRMGTSEIYGAVEALPEINDCMVIDLELLGRESYLPLFVVLADGADLTDDLRKRIAKTLRENVSPRHVPNDVFAVESIPYTLSGKKMEVPVRKILLGYDSGETLNRGAMRNPEALDYFIDFAQGLDS